MKLLLFLLMITIANASCKKCGDCTRITTTSVKPNIQGYPITTIENFTACGAEYRTINRGDEVSITVQNGQYSVTSVSTTQCVLR